MPRVGADRCAARFLQTRTIDPLQPVATGGFGESQFPPDWGLLQRPLIRESPCWLTHGQSPRRAYLAAGRSCADWPACPCAPDFGCIAPCRPRPTKIGPGATLHEPLRAHQGAGVANFYLFKELKRRNVLRAAVLYIGAVWAISQGISQLSGPLGLANWVTVWFLIACAIGFPFWIAFAWLYEFTPSGLKRESAVDPADSVAHDTARKLNYWIFGVMALAIVLL